MRIRSLDGLRGVAALVVVLDHTLLVNPRLAKPLEPQPEYPELASGSWWLVSTPLHLFWAGIEAVLVFFVLSGVVLSIPHRVARRAASISWVGYYPRRLVRLYVPVCAALLVAVPLMVLLGREVIDGAPWWTGWVPFDLGPRGVLGDALLLGDPGSVIAPLWSLKWEVVFSLLLPGFLLGARLTSRLPAVLVGAGIVALMLVGVWTPGGWLLWLPVFAFGVLLATHADRLEAVCATMRPWQWLAFGAVALALLLNRWLIAGIPAFAGVVERGRFPHLSLAPAAVGATMTVVLAWHCRPVARCLEGRSAGWLGLRSFSLYLVHMPIVVVVANVFSGWNLLSVPLVLALSLAAAHVFHRSVEVPSILWSRRAGAWASSRVGSKTEREDPTPGLP